MEQQLETPEAGRTDVVPGEMIVRSFAAELTAGDGRTIDVRVVPYGEKITHDDGLGGVPKGIPYTEEWAQGAFAHQVNAANRVLVNFEHQTGLAGIVGHGKALLERDDGLYGSFKIHETPDGDKALLLVQEGAVQGVSLEAFGRKSIRTGAGVIRRVKADLHGIALTRRAAYTGAMILALREPAQTVLDEALLPVAFDPELIERCRRLGIKIPQRYQAHPDDTGTPAETGTPEDGTRPAQ
jgi:HK97 family phage prohead protease